ncbi:MAG: hypothetical protein V4858_07775 [Pseudomonadota bacterium]
MTGPEYRCGVLWARALLAAMVLAWLSPLWAKTTVFYPQPESVDARQAYPLKVLALALTKAGADFELLPSRSVMTQSRALIQLSRGVGADVNVVWTMTSKEREDTFLPIRIPIDKGLLGWRIFLIHRSKAAQFATVKTLNDLKKYEAGQGHDWPDTDILRASGLRVQGIAKYDGLFKMLESGRIDYFPRSVVEIWAEEKSHSDMELEIEKTVILQYPAALYFFVKKDNTALASVIEAGMRIAVKDGSFDKLFAEEYEGDIKRANLKARTRFQLPNPLLPEQTPLQDKKLWFGDL